jgi:hypothetical protein
MWGLEKMKPRVPKYIPWITSLCKWSSIAINGALKKKMVKAKCKKTKTTHPIILLQVGQKLPKFSPQ